jgi:glycosyltransferase involved in cell wall biosynthesis
MSGPAAGPTTILHLITGLETGGAEQMLARLVSRLDPARFRSVVVSMTGPGTIGPKLTEAGIELLSLDLPPGRPDPRGLLRLVRIVRTVRPNILLTWLYHADLLGLLAKPFLGECRLYWNIRCTESWNANVVRRMLVAGSRMPDAVVVNSSAGQLFHEGIGYRPRRWEMIPNGYDTGIFRRDEAARASLRRELDIAADAVAIGLPARYHPMKDHATFLAAATRLAATEPKVVFVLAGPGVAATNGELTDMIAAAGLGGRIRLLGNRGDMVRVYSALDIVTLSSAYGEGHPNVLGEAMSCEIVCAATDVGDAAELIGPTGAVAPPRDPEALAAAWQGLAELGAEGRRTRGKEARERIVRLYDIDAVTKRYEVLFNSF